MARAYGSMLEAMIGNRTDLGEEFGAGLSAVEIDWLVDTARRDRAVLGARLTGGGFGGCILMLCTPGAPKDTAQRIVDTYRRKYGKKADVLMG